MPPQPSHQPRPQQPQRSFTPQAPHIDYGAMPQQDFQQHRSGHYEIVPPPQTGPNDGHSGHNPYDFIMSPGAQPKHRLSITGNGSFLKLIGLLIGGATILIVVAAILITVLTPKGSIPGMTAIAARQQEIVRVSTAATQKATRQETKNFVTNVETTVTTSQMQVIGYLSAHHAKLSHSALAIDQSSQIDTQLANAASANDYDGAVIQNLADQLQTYQSLLKSTYQQTNSQQAKQLLRTNFNGASLLLKQAKAVQSHLGN